MKTFWMSVVAASFMSSLVSGCANTPTGKNTLEGEWVLTRAVISEHSITPSDLDSKFTLNINMDGTVNGLSSCNRWRSTYAVESDKLSIGAVAKTKKRCNLSTDNQKLITRKFPNTLSTPATISLDHDTLTLTWSEKEYWKFKLRTDEFE